MPILRKKICGRLIDRFMEIYAIIAIKRKYGSTKINFPRFIAVRGILKTAF
jgi:hypothetical protein